MATVLLLLELKALPQHLNERQRALLELYTWVSDPGEPLPPSGSNLKQEEDFLLMQSFVMAIQWKDAKRADRSFTELMPKLKSAFLIGLGLDIVLKLYNGSYDE